MFSWIKKACIICLPSSPIAREILIGITISWFLFCIASSVTRDGSGGPYFLLIVFFISFFAIVNCLAKLVTRYLPSKSRGFIKKQGTNDDDAYNPVSIFPLIILAALVAAASGYMLMSSIIVVWPGKLPPINYIAIGFSISITTGCILAIIAIIVLAGRFIYRNKIDYTLMVMSTLSLCIFLILIFACTFDLLNYSTRNCMDSLEATGHTVSMSERNIVVDTIGVLTTYTGHPNDTKAAVPNNYYTYGSLLDDSEKLGFTDYMYFSAATLFTVSYNDIYPYGATMKIIAMAEIIVRYVLFALIVAVGVSKLSSGDKPRIVVWCDFRNKKTEP